MVTIKWLEEHKDIGAKKGEVQEQTNETLAKEWEKAGLVQILTPAQSKRGQRAPTRVVAK